MTTNYYQLLEVKLLGGVSNSNLEEISFELLFGLGVKWNRFAIFFTPKNFQSSGFPIRLLTHKKYF